MSASPPDASLASSVPTADDGPPAPPSLPKLTPVTKGAWAALFGGPGYLVAATMAGWSVPGIAAFCAVAAFVTGFAILVLRMNDRDDHQANPGRDRQRRRQALATRLALYRDLVLAKGSGQQRGTGRVVSTAANLLTAAARLLPTAHRSRYTEEYRSELWDLAQAGAGRVTQLRYALCQFRNALPMSVTLRAPRRRSSVP